MTTYALIVFFGTFGINSTDAFSSFALPGFFDEKECEDAFSKMGEMTHNMTKHVCVKQTEGIKSTWSIVPK